MVNKIKRLVPALLVAIVFLAIWEIAVALFDVPQWLLPAPSAIGTEMLTIWSRLMVHAWATLEMTLLGFFVGSLAGVLIATLLHYVPGARTALYPLLVLTQNIPLIVLGDLLVIWFGFGILPKLILLILVCFFPVSVAMLTGLALAERTHIVYFKMIGATRWQLFRHVELPNSLSYLFSGLKIAASYCVIGAIYAETIGSQQGLGVFIRLASNGFQTSRVFAGIVIIVLISVLLFAVIAACERVVLRWKIVKDDC